MKNCTLMINDNVRITAIHRPDFILTLRGCFKDFQMEQSNLERYQFPAEHWPQQHTAVVGFLRRGHPLPLLCAPALMVTCLLNRAQHGHPDWWTKAFYIRTRIKFFSSLLARSTQASLCSPRASVGRAPPPWPCLCSYLGYPDAKRSS